MTDASLEKDFLLLCKREGMIGIEGHRNVGGFRVSMYNAMPMSSVEALTELINEFINKYSS